MTTRLLSSTFQHIAFVFLLASSLLASSCKTLFPGKIEPWTKIEYELSECLKGCIAFKMQIDPNGNVVYRESSKGKSFTKNFVLTKKEIRELNDLLEPAAINPMKEEYDYGAEDTQQKFLFLHTKDTRKEIRFGQDIPEFLKKIEAVFARIINAHLVE